MFITIDGIFPSENLQVAQELLTHLPKALNRSSTEFDLHVPLSQNPQGTLPFPPPFSPGARLLYYAAHMRQCMDLIEPNHRHHLHIGANWHDTLITQLGEYSVESWHKILAYASPLKIDLSIHLLHHEDISQERLSFTGKIQGLLELLSIRRQLPGHPRTLAFTLPHLTPEGTLSPQLLHAILQALPKSD